MHSMLLLELLPLLEGSGYATGIIKSRMKRPWFSHKGGELWHVHP